MSELKSTTRFSDRVDDYIKYRPHYPSSVLDFFKANLGLTSQDVVADIGSGTGISAEMFLQNGNTVYAVEPNREMRVAAERELSDFPRLVSVEGTAERTSLQDHSIDFAIAAQAFHWFEPKAARAEFLRFLKPEGWTVLMWNKRLTDTTPFLRDYENLILEFGTDYKRVRHPDIEKSEVMTDFFGPSGYRTKTFFNAQEFDFPGLLGRLTSSSYAPKQGHPGFEAMKSALKALYERHQSGGSVRIEYDTNLFYGQLAL